MKNLVQVLSIAVAMIVFLAFPMALLADSDDFMNARAFYGSVTINGKLAPVGTVLKAVGEGVRPGQFNPVTLKVEGYYGEAGTSYGSPLVIQGEIEEGTPITFYFNGAAGDFTYYWPAESIEPRHHQLDLDVTIPESSTELTSSANPSRPAQSVTFTASVSSVELNEYTPAGTVSFYIDGEMMSEDGLSAGMAQYSTSSLAAGTYEIKAVYSGDQVLLGSEDALDQTVRSSSSSGGGGGGVSGEYVPATTTPPAATTTAPPSTVPATTPPAVTTTPPAATTPAATVTTRPPETAPPSSSPAASSPASVPTEKTTPSATAEAEPEEPSRTGMIIGIVVGCAVVIAAASVILIRRRGR
ncbi:MAG: Ig-like domain repeat protein [Dehalococcoidales bacterium]|nr:Ig-like domain repeat protein [Dehalococcoidales bacterium]